MGLLWRLRFSYTTEPTGDLDVPRLTQQYPDYWVCEHSFALKPKTLIFADWTYPEWTEEKANRVYSVFNDLLKRGFIIYIWESKVLTKLTQHTLIALKNRDIKIISPEAIKTLEEQLITQYKVPIDQIMVLEPFMLSWLIGNQEEAPRGILNLSSLFYATKGNSDQLVSLIRLMKQYPYPLRVLNVDLISSFLDNVKEVLSDFPEVHLLETQRTHASIKNPRESSFLPITSEGLGLLRTLKIIGTAPPNYELNRLLAQLSAIETLIIECFDNQANGFLLLGRPTLIKLRSVTLPPMSMDDINRLLHESRHLEEISIIVNRPNQVLSIGTEKLKGLSLSAQSELFPLQPLLPLLKSLSKLTLKRKISGPINTEGLQTGIKYFCLDQCDLDLESLGKLIGAMPYLESLIIKSYAHYADEFKLPPKSLSCLKLLDVSEQYFDLESGITFLTLSMLLTAAADIEALHLEGCSYLAGGDADSEGYDDQEEKLEANTLKKLRLLKADESGSGRRGASPDLPQNRTYGSRIRLLMLIVPIV